MRDRKQEAIDALIIVGLMAALFFMTYQCQAAPVKHCRNAETGQIITVEAGMPCPYPTHEV